MNFCMEANPENLFEEKQKATNYDIIDISIRSDTVHMLGLIYSSY